MYVFLDPDLGDAVAHTVELDGRIAAVKMLNKVNNPVRLGMHICNIVAKAIEDGNFTIDHNGYYKVQIAA
jgi:hypothetical protein